jgi:hypothetical protein
VFVTLEKESKNDRNSEREKERMKEREKEWIKERKREFSFLKNFDNDGHKLGHKYLSDSKAKRNGNGQNEDFFQNNSKHGTNSLKMDDNWIV